MFRIKICGITSSDDARIAVDAGADAIGLNFFRKSRRFVDPETARTIASVLPPHVMKVGVFVNHSVTEITEIASQIGLDAIQLHGDESPQFLAQLPLQARIVRAHRCGKNGLAPLAQFLADSRANGRAPDAVLIDADAGAEFGGTGHVADWSRITSERRSLAGLPLILAGGLKPANVSDAITVVRPDGVDVASGVEREPGIKDEYLVGEFVAAAKQAFAHHA
jgi:phosphoribosylanthranilate isomerase